MEAVLTNQMELTTSPFALVKEILPSKFQNGKDQG